MLNFLNYNCLISRRKLQGALNLYFKMYNNSRITNEGERMNAVSTYYLILLVGAAIFVLLDVILFSLENIFCPLSIILRIRKACVHLTYQIL